MAKPKSRVAGRTPPSERDLSRFLLWERLRGPIVPGTLAAVGVLVGVLSGAGAINVEPALVVLASVAVALCLFFGLRDFIGGDLTPTRSLAIVAFLPVFAAAALYPFVRTIFPPPAIASGDLEPGGRPLQVSVPDGGGPYRIVVDGHLPPSADRSNQSAHYRMTVERSGAPPAVLEGEFSERWGMRRLGRRGSAPVHYTRSSTVHEIDDPSGEGFRVVLDEIVPPTSHGVTVHVYPEAVSPLVFVGIGAAATAGALLIDAWRAAEGGDGLMTMLALASLLGTASFRRFAPPHPGLGDLIFNAVLGGVVGAGAGALLWRVSGRSLRSRLS
jgi:hypothetical protein